MISNPMLLTVKEVSEHLRVNATCTYDLINLGLLPALNLGRKKVRRATLESFLETYDGVDLDAIIAEKKLERKAEQLLEQEEETTTSGLDLSIGIELLGDWENED